VVGDLTPEQTVVFLDIMGIGVEDFVKYGTAEAIWPGSSPLSTKIKTEVGSLSVDDIALYLAAKDYDAATSFQYELKFEKLLERGHRFVLSLSTAIAIFVGTIIFHVSMRSHTVAYKTGMDLGYYFAGYYLFAFAVFIVLEYPIVRPSGILALLLWVIEFIMTATLMVQFWIFMNAVYAISYISCVDHNNASSEHFLGQEY
jgi:hypothetical protein